VVANELNLSFLSVFAIEVNLDIDVVANELNTHRIRILITHDLWQAVLLKDQFLVSIFCLD